MAERVSSLAGHTAPRRRGAVGDCGVVMREIPNLRMHQIAAWPKSVREVAALAANTIGATNASGAGESVQTARGILLRVTPLVWWLRANDSSVVPPTLDARLGTTLDISHAYTLIQIRGANAAELLNRYVPLDLRARAFPPGAVACSALHHIGVTLHRPNINADSAAGVVPGYELFIPRGFALSVWELLQYGARQFGVEVTA